MIYYALFLFVFNALFSHTSSYPYLSGDTWYFFCDHKLTEAEGFDPKQVRRGDTIFVESTRLKRFSHKYLPRIRNPFILITPNSGVAADNPLPGPYQKLATSSKVAAWFLQNIDCEASDKLIPIPIGLANSFLPHGNPVILDKATSHMKDPSSREMFIYVNFCIGNNVSARKACYDHCKTLSKTHIAQVKDFGSYLQDLANASFIISPPGNGLDCHRTWEALLMKCYPVVLSSTLNPLYEKLPVVVVNSWEELTEDFLLQKQKEFQNQTFEYERLYAPYWFDKVRNAQEKIRSQSPSLFERIRELF